MNERSQRYDRELLLLGAQRKTVLDLSEVELYGRDSYGEIDAGSISGMRPVEWYAKGVRLLGRTAVECTRDQLGNAIGKGAATIAATSPPAPRTLVVDLFAGSG